MEKKIHVTTTVLNPGIVGSSTTWDHYHDSLYQYWFVAGSGLESDFLSKLRALVAKRSFFNVEITLDLYWDLKVFKLV